MIEKIRVIKQLNQEQKIKNPLLHKSQCDLYNTELDERLKNNQRQQKIKEIFSSQGLILSCMNDQRNESPIKLKSKITSKEYGLTMFETNLSKQEEKRFRKNSCHHFHNKAGFYMQ